MSNNSSFPYQPSDSSSDQGSAFSRFSAQLPQRSRAHRMLGGVCGGLAREYGMRPYQVRLIVVLLAFLPGPMWVVYALAWILMPLEPRAQYDPYMSAPGAPMYDPAATEYTTQPGYTQTAPSDHTQGAPSDNHI